MTKAETPAHGAARPLDDKDLDAVSGGAQVIVGTAAGESIGRGGDQDLVILAGAGNDYIGSGHGNNVIFAGSGNDTIVSGDGNDTIEGQRGDDVIFARGGDDTIVWYPGDGNDFINGGDGHDSLIFRDTGLTAEQLLETFKPFGDKAPVIVNGQLDVTGVAGTFTIGGQTIQFREMERVILE